jgi:transcriptional regulator with XRE-family HTH domain
MRTLDGIMNELPEHRRAKIEARARELIRAYTLQQVRELVAKTHQEVAERLGTGQGNVSRLERRRDALVSNVAGFIEALGGRLRLVAELPDGTEVEVTLPCMAERADANPEPDLEVRVR